MEQVRRDANRDLRTKRSFTETRRHYGRLTESAPRRSQPRGQSRFSETGHPPSVEVAGERPAAAVSDVPGDLPRASRSPRPPRPWAATACTRRPGVGTAPVAGGASSSPNAPGRGVRPGCPVPLNLLWPQGCDLHGADSVGRSWRPVVSVKLRFVRRTRSVSQQTCFAVARSPQYEDRVHGVAVGMDRASWSGFGETRARIGAGSTGIRATSLRQDTGRGGRR